MSKKLVQPLKYKPFIKNTVIYTKGDDIYISLLPDNGKVGDINMSYFPADKLYRTSKKVYEQYFDDYYNAPDKALQFSMNERIKWQKLQYDRVFTHDEIAVICKKWEALKKFVLEYNEIKQEMIPNGSLKTQLTRAMVNEALKNVHKEDLFKTDDDK